MKLTQALIGFFFHLKANGYSDNTIDLYQYMLRTLNEFLEDPSIDSIQPNDLNSYFVYLRDDYIPHRQGGNTKPLSGSTLQNHWKAIRSFFKWAEDDLGLKVRPDTKLKLPTNNPKTIQPLTEEEVKRLLTSAEYTRMSNTTHRHAFRMKRPTAARDSALIIELLDTGIRAGEAARLNVENVNLEGEIYIEPFGNSQRKTKSRVVPIGKATIRALWKYINSREGIQKGEPLFLTKSQKRIDRNVIRLLLKDLGDKAAVPNCHPHRLRHTFGIEYLRNGGDIFTLQLILGHSSLEMVRKYLQIAQTDTQNAHRKASPADRWRL